jgi:tRNA pseudouridine38-40 synthase
MRSAAACLVGRHDFAAFGSPEPLLDSEGESRRRSSTRHIEAVRFERTGAGILSIEFVGNAFMKHMIRSIVGTLLLVGSGHMSPADFEMVLNSRDRRFAGPTVPAHGLYLVEVIY